MHRFFVPPAWITGETARLEGDVARQVVRVLRMSPGDEIILLDNSGSEYRVSLTKLNRDTVEGDVLSVANGRGEPSVHVTLYQGMLKGKGFEWVLQKGTEIGVTTFVPLICRRSILQELHVRQGTRHPRWDKIVAEAAEQSGRCTLPLVEPLTSFEDACKSVRGSSSVSLIPWELEEATDLRSALQGMESQQVNIFIGPEGGFEEREVEHARSCGILSVSLGRRILRSETAAIATLAAVLYESGDLGG